LLLHTFTFPINFYNNLNDKNSEGKNATTYMLTFVCFKKVGLVYGRVGDGAGAASKFLPGAV
jgi:hypothetical protein